MPAKFMFAMLLVFITSLSIDAQSAHTLPAKADRYLKANYPGWSIGQSWRADLPWIPAVVKGDFNGDGKQDVAVLLKKDDRTYAIALVATKTSYKATNLLAQGRDDSWVAGIDIVGKGMKLEGLEDPNKVLIPKYDCISLYDGERIGMVFQWQNGAFKRLDGF